jgi:hypothetical protein
VSVSVRVPLFSPASVTRSISATKSRKPTPTAFPAGDDAIPFTAEWRYFDAGPIDGTAWTATDFDDAAWPSGRAVLGLLDEDTFTDTATATFYVRRRVTLARPSGAFTATLRVVADDGAVCYMNGAAWGSEQYCAPPLELNLSCVASPYRHLNRFFPRALCTERGACVRLAVCCPRVRRG